VKGRGVAGRLALVAVGVALGVSPATARSLDPIVHEPIPPDPREDLAMHVALAGQLPAALETRSGLVSAPDPARPPSSTETTYGKDAAAPGSSYTPDRDTRRPELAAYDDPFTPSMAPFKRMRAYDSVGADYKLHVFDERPVLVATNNTPLPGDDVFYANMVVDITPGRSARIPSVGPGSRIVHASLTDGAEEIPFRVVRDGAENWSLDAPAVRSPRKARLVMEIAIARAAFGGPLANVSWDHLQQAPPLPPNVALEAAEVRRAIGVSRELSPRDAVGKLVVWFRSFEQSDQPPQGRSSIYLDLALSKKGVCRHRSFAFLVTALSLGIPARFVMNDTHAWVEVNDGAIWKRVDLGGAGHLASQPSQPTSEEEAPPYEPPADAFAWPRSGERGTDMVNAARAGGTSAPKGPAPARSSDPISSPKSSDGQRVRSEPSVTLVVADNEPHRGQPLRVSGEVRAEGQACAHAAVDVFLRDPKTSELTRLGTVSTGDDGNYAGSIVVPGTLRLGAYDVVAKTDGVECGAVR
jgi:hypothetical protein